MPDYSTWSGPSAGYRAGMFVRNFCGILWGGVCSVLVVAVVLAVFAGPGLLWSWLEAQEPENTLPPTYAADDEGFHRRCEAQGVVSYGNGK